jgi:predicted HAD superfamily Cof-like phosphohydrolase
MSKVKQYYTDVAEKAVDKIINQVKQNLITKETAIADILKVDNLNLIGIDEHNVDEVIDMECA